MILIQTVQAFNAAQRESTLRKIDELSVSVVMH